MKATVIGLVISALGTLWAIIWGVFTYKRAKPPSTQRESRASQSSELIRHVSLEEVKKYDPKVKAVIEAAERQLKSPPLAMASGPSPAVIRVLAFVTTGLGVLFLILTAFLVGADSWFAKLLMKAVSSLFTLAAGLFLALLFYVALGYFLAFCVYGGVRLLRKLKSFWRDRKLVAIILWLLFVPFWFTFVLVFAAFTYLEQFVLCFAFYSDKLLDEQFAKRLKFISGD